MKKFLILAFAAALSGCAMTAQHCQSADWYRLGYRDGYEAAPPNKGSMLNTYTAECAVHSVKPDNDAYAKGLVVGAENRLYWWGPGGWP